MSGPMRISERGTKTEQRLVRALKNERLSGASRERMAAAIGIGVGVGIGATAASVSAAATAGTASTAASLGAVTSKSATWLGSLGIAKIVGAVVVGGILASATVAEFAHVGGWAGERSPTVQAEPRRPSAPAPVRTSAPMSQGGAAPDLPPGVPVGAGVAKEPLPPPPVPPVAPVPRARAAEATSGTLAIAPYGPKREESSEQKRENAQAPGPTLGDETAELEQAQRALGADRAADALALLDRHDRDFPSPMLDLEADLLRIEVLAALGRTREARARGEAFLAAHPGAPQARHVQTLLSKIDGASNNP
jgi:hypothetical protein